MHRLRDLGLATLLLLSAAGFGIGIGMIVNERIIPNVYTQGASYSAGNVLTAGAALPGTCTVGALYSLTVSPFTLNQCRATDVWSAVGTGTGGDWNTYIVKSVNQDVTASTTLANDSELLFAGLGNAEAWYIEAFLVYSGDQLTTDIKIQATFPSSTILYDIVQTDSNLLAASSSIYATTATTLTQIIAGTRTGIGTYLSLRLRISLSNIDTGGTFQIQQANNSSGVTRLAAGSILRAKKLR